MNYLVIRRAHTILYSRMVLLITPKRHDLNAIIPKSIYKTIK